MTFRSLIKRFCFVAALLPALWGCGGGSDADELPLDPTPVAADEVTYLRLYVTTGSSSRATGGEQGDYSEQGINHENEIDNLTIFIYNDPDGMGLDGPADTPISFGQRYTRSLLSTMEGGDHLFTLPIPVRNYIPREGDRVVVAANIPDRSGAINLGMLREVLVESSFESASMLSDYRYFAMSSADNDSRIQMDAAHTGSAELPFYAKVNLERLAARIDFTIPSADAYRTDLGCIDYTVAETGAHVYLTHILPVNVMAGGSYLLKRVTVTAPLLPADMASEPLIFCGEESGVWTDGALVPTNYVVEPRTLLKTEDGDRSLLDEWFGASRAGNIDGNAAAFTADYSVASLLASNGGKWLTMPLGSTAGRGIIVSYADENTCHRSLQSSSFITGLALRVVYQPPVVYEDAGLAQALPASDFAPDPATLTGRTIYRYCPDGLGSDEDRCLYFSNAEAAEAYLAAHPAEYATVQSFIDGVCYYNLWLSHATPAPGDYTCPMQYAVVRNNIYRVSVSFTGPGVQPPEIADVKPGAMDCRIYVRKWNVVNHSTIII